MRVRTGVFVSLMTVAMLATLLTPMVRAFIPEPYELYGVARDSAGVVLTVGSPIRSFVDGVDYSNKTSVFSRPAMNDGYFDIDTYGNHRTNLTDPGTPWIKEGADDMEPIMYTWGDFSNNTQIGGPSQPWLQGQVFKETHDWETGLPPQAGDLNLAPAANQPPGLKIFSITTNSTITPFTDYVWLCNPTPNQVDGSQFYLEKDVLGSTSGPTVPITGTIQPYERYFVDTGLLNYFVEAGDNLKLVWTNTPGPNAAFGGNDIVVDRVEFNKTPTGGALNWEPGNTIMNNEPAPDRGSQINRSAMCRDTNSVQRDFFTDIEVRKNDPPYAPDPIGINGLYNWTIDSRMYHLTVLNNFPINWTHHDKNSDPQTQANIRISRDPDGVNTIWTGNVVGPTQLTTYNALDLLAGTCYYLGVQTKDTSSFGPWGEIRFCTNGLPAPANRLWPSFSWTTSPKPDQQVFWDYSTDLDPGDSLNYTWWVSTSPSMTPVISTGTTTLNSSNPFATVPSTTYYWCVNTSDGWQMNSNCGTPWPFSTSVPPSPPTASNLRIATYGSTNSLRLHLTNRVNPLLDWDFNPSTRSQTGFHVQVLDDTAAIYWELNNTGPGGDLSEVTYAGPALLDGDCYTFQVKVRDDLAPALWSVDWGAPLDFCINTPPPVPTPLAPANATSRFAGSTVIYWSVVVDADAGDSITYNYCVAAQDPPYPGCASASGQPTVNSSNAFVTVVGSDYYWAVQSFDQYEYSAWSAVWTFTAVAQNTEPNISITTPAGGESLEQGSQYTITWTMDDNEDTVSQLVVVLKYTVNNGAEITIATNLVGQTSYTWTVPSDVESSAVRIVATVTDTGDLTDTATSQQFSIVAPPPKDGEFPLMWVILIIIIVVVLALVLLLLMKRKKPKGEEEAAPAEEVVEEEEMTEEEAPAPPPKAAPKAAAPAAAKSPAKTKECPSCGTIVSATDKECFMCGAKL